MSKKISILTLTLLFFISTTALPISIHLCQMAEMEDVCEHIMVKKVSCCEEEGNENELCFVRSMEPCCTDQFIDASLKDKFISAKVDKKEETFSILLLPNLDYSIDFSNYKEVLFFTDTSPPHLISNNIYLLNSVFLI